MKFSGFDNQQCDAFKKSALMKGLNEYTNKYGDMASLCIAASDVDIPVKVIDGYKGKLLIIKSSLVDSKCFYLLEHEYLDKFDDDKKFEGLEAKGSFTITKVISTVDGGSFKEEYEVPFELVKAYLNHLKS